MTREEAREEIFVYMRSNCYLDAPSNEACEIAVKALRPVSREQVEKVWKGCQRCTAPEDEALDAGGAHDFRVLGDGLYYFDGAYGWEGENILFCPWCGGPLTDDAVEMVMERLEALHETI